MSDHDLAAALAELEDMSFGFSSSGDFPDDVSSSNESSCGLIGVKPASTANSARKPVAAEEDHADAHVANLLAELDGLDFGGSDSGSSGGGAGGGDDAEMLALLDHLEKAEGDGGGVSDGKAKAKAATVPKARSEGESDIEDLLATLHDINLDGSVSSFTSSHSGATAAAAAAAKKGSAKAPAAKQNNRLAALSAEAAFPSMKSLDMSNLIDGLDDLDLGATTASDSKPDAGPELDRNSVVNGEASPLPARLKPLDRASARSGRSATSSKPPLPSSNTSVPMSSNASVHTDVTSTRGHDDDESSSSAFKIDLGDLHNIVAGMDNTKKVTDKMRARIHGEAGSESGRSSRGGPTAPNSDFGVMGGDGAVGGASTVSSASTAERRRRRERNKARRSPDHSANPPQARQRASPVSSHRSRKRSRHRSGKHDKHGHGRAMSPISLASTYISSVDSRDHRRHHGANHHARHAPRRHDHRHRAGRPSLDGSRQIPPRETVVEARRDPLFESFLALQKRLRASPNYRSGLYVMQKLSLFNPADAYNSRVLWAVMARCLAGLATRQHAVRGSERVVITERWESRNGAGAADDGDGDAARANQMIRDSELLMEVQRRKIKELTDRKIALLTELRHEDRRAERYVDEEDYDRMKYYYRKLHAMATAEVKQRDVAINAILQSLPSEENVGHVLTAEAALAMRTGVRRGDSGDGGSTGGGGGSGGGRGSSRRGSASSSSSGDGSDDLARLYGRRNYKQAARVSQIRSRHAARTLQMNATTAMASPSIAKLSLLIDQLKGARDGPQAAARGRR